MVKKIGKVLKSNDGSISPFFLAMLIVLVAGIALLLSYNQTVSIGGMVKEAMQQTVRTVVIRNTEETYISKREGYAGAYGGKKGSWAENVELPNAKQQLKEILGMTEKGANLVKLDTGGIELYRLESIALDISNTSFADETNNFKATLTLTVTAPITADGTKKEVPLHLTVYATNYRKF